jgi:putative ABC transport system ATP-binding protein
MGGHRAIAVPIDGQRLAAVAVVTHDPRSIDLFDRILDMNDGRIVGERRPDGLA